MTNTIQPTADGPLMVEGDVDLLAADGTSIRKSTNKMWLCRCGHSESKPFCDASHNNTGFKDAANVAVDYVIKRAEPGTPGENLVLTLRNDGPIHCFGAMRVVGPNGGWQGEQANLCRCGRSANKPFCDGSHRTSGFAAD